MQMTRPVGCFKVGISETRVRNAAAWDSDRTTDRGRVEGFSGDDAPYPVIVTMPVEGMVRLELVLLAPTHNVAPRATITTAARRSKDLRNMLLALIPKGFIN